MARTSIYPPSVKPGIPVLGKKPEGWVETTFGAVLKPVVRKAKLIDDQEYQLVVAKRNRGGVVPRTKRKGSEIKTQTQFFLRENDFLISRRQIIHGACGIVPAPLDGSVVSNEYSALRVQDGLLLDYLKYFCHTTYFQQTCFQSSVGVDVEKMVFKIEKWFKWPIYVPPIREQHRIVEILSTWDEAIALTDRLVAALEERKKGLMQLLLTREVRFPGCKEEWKTKKLDSLGTFIKGVGIQRSDITTKGIPCIRYGEIYTTYNSTVRKLISFTSEEAALSSQPIQTGDLLFAGSGETREDIGKCVAYLGEEKAYAGGDIIILRPSLGDPKFLGYLLNHQVVTRQTYKLAQGHSIVHIYANHLKEIVIPFPPLEEQRRIAEVLEISDIEIRYQQQILSLLQRQKKGLMNRLLTGEVRVAI
jgi:type I restriction enzyme S subunit